MKNNLQNLLKKVAFGLIILTSCLLSNLPITHAQVSNLAITSPGAGQIWATGTTQKITWIPTNINIYGINPTVDIDLNPLPCGPANDSPTCSSSSSTPYIIVINAPDTGSYTWNIPEPMAPSYIGPANITVVEFANGSGSTQAISGQFTVSETNSNSNPSSTASAQLISPATGADWPISSTQTIQWLATSSTASQITIKLLPVAPSCSGTIIQCANSYTIGTNLFNNGSYSWTINSDINEQGIPTGQYKINILDANTNSVIASSEGLFSITVPQPEISQLSTNSAPIGTTVTVIGSNFTSDNNSVGFGVGTYINNLISTNGDTIQFVVPQQTQPCPANNNGPCSMLAGLILPGAYGITVTNANGVSNTLPFMVTPTAGTNIMLPASEFTNPTEIGFANGSLVQLNGSPTVYLVSNNNFVPFSSAQIFMAYGYQWQEVQTISANQLNSQLISLQAVLAPNGSIIKTADNPTVYMVVNGQKSAIPSIAIFNRLNLNLNNLIIVSDEDLQDYPSAAIQQ